MRPKAVCRYCHQPRGGRYAAWLVCPNCHSFWNREQSKPLKVSEDFAERARAVYLGDAPLSALRSSPSRPAAIALDLQHKRGRR
jgi:hypothetical protein